MWRFHRDLQYITSPTQSFAGGLGLQGKSYNSYEPMAFQIGDRVQDYEFLNRVDTSGSSET